MEKIISQAYTFLNERGFDWSICGGTAIDLFLGKKIRVHKDLDVAVFWEDRNLIIDLMLNSGWRVLQACGGGVVKELNKKQGDPFEKRNLFCFTSKEDRVNLEPVEDNKFRFGLEKREQIDFTYVEFLFNERNTGDLYLPGESNIKRELDKAILPSLDGISYLAPEIVLFYKSSYLDGFDTADHNYDFDASLPYMNAEQRQWLKKALEWEYPNGHVWLQRLS
jgi:hypothetical protein